jgi:predicted ABC-type ATPase
MECEREARPSFKDLGGGKWHLICHMGTPARFFETLTASPSVLTTMADRSVRARILLHYIVIGSATQAVARVALRVRVGGHHVAEDDVHRRYDSSRQHFLEDYLPLADEWGLWENQTPPAAQIADSKTHALDQLHIMLNSNSLQEATPREMSEMSKIVLEASRGAT